MSITEHPNLSFTVTAAYGICFTKGCNADSVPILFAEHGDPLYVRMPCGQKRSYGAGDIEVGQDEPCPCGDSTHWLVKWLDAEF